jgi:cobalamin biosynthesis Mg chelatase CobN
MKIGALLAPFGPARGIVVGTYIEALEQLIKEGRTIELRIDNLANADQSAADPDPDFMQWLLSDADVVLAHIPPAYDALFVQLQELYQKTGKPVIALSPECAAAAGGVDAQHIKSIWAYQSNGGLENIKNLLGFAAHITGFSPQSVPPPKPMPSCGIYHPDSQGPFDTLDDYLNWRPLQGDSHTVGLFFPRSYWIDGSLDMFDALIRELEGRHVNVIAVFNDKFKGGGDDAAIEKFFMRDGAAVVDTVVFQAYFFL